MLFKKNYTITNVPPERTLKCKMAGNTEVVDNNIKRVVLLNRNTLEVIASQIVAPDHTFKLFAQDQGDGQHLLIGFDEGANFNIDGFDRLSMGDKTFTPDPAAYTNVLNGSEAFWLSELKTCKVNFDFVKMEGDYITECPLANIFLKMDGEKTGHFEDGAGNTLNLNGEYSFLKDVSYIRLAEADMPIAKLNNNIVEFKKTHTQTAKESVTGCFFKKHHQIFSLKNSDFSIFKNTDFALHADVETGLVGEEKYNNIKIVPDKFQTIQAAVDASQDGDAVFIKPGVYTSNKIVINRAVSLVGQGEKPEDVQIISPADVSWTINYELPTVAGKITIENLTIKNTREWGECLVANATGASVPFDIYINNCSFFTSGTGYSYRFPQRDGTTTHFKNCDIRKGYNHFVYFNYGEVLIEKCFFNSPPTFYGSGKTLPADSDYVTVQTEGYGVASVAPPASSVIKSLIFFSAIGSPGAKIHIDLSAHPEIFEKISDSKEIGILVQDKVIDNIEIFDFDMSEKKGHIFFNIENLNTSKKTFFGLAAGVQSNMITVATAPVSTDAVAEDYALKSFFVSFDGGKTFKTRKNTAWESIASSDPAEHGVIGQNKWHYKAADETWEECMVNSAVYALYKANQIFTNKFPVEKLETISPTQWLETGGMSAQAMQMAFVPDFAFKKINQKILSVQQNQKIWWTSDIYDLSAFSGKIVGSILHYVIEVCDGDYDYDYSQIEVWSILTGGDWQKCTRNGAIPGINPGMVTTGVKLQIKLSAPLDLPERTKINILTRIQ